MMMHAVATADLDRVRASADRIAKAARELRASELADRVEQVLEGLQRERFHLVVVGEFKRGKSSLVNTLLGVDLLPTDVLPATAALHVVEHGEERRATVVFVDGRQEPWDPSPEQLARLSVGGDVDSSKIRFVVVALPSPLLKDGLVLIDTPGVNDLSSQREEVTYGFLANADAALFLLDSTQPLSASEARFLEAQVLNRSVDKVLFVLAKADRLSPEELEEALEGARTRLREVLGREPPPVVPFSTKARVPAETGTLADARENLLRFLDPLRAEAEAERVLRCRRRLDSLAAELRAAVSRATQLAQLKGDEREAEARRLRQETNRTDVRFQKLLAGIDLVGQETLTRLVSESLKKLRQDVQDDLLHRIDVLPGNVQAFASTEIPHTIRRALRVWTQNKSAEINTFLQKLTERIAADYQAVFGVQMASSLGGQAIELPAVEVMVGAGTPSGHASDELLKTQLLPVAGGVLAGLWLLSGPIGLLAGALAGQYFGARMREKRTNEQRSVLRQVLPSMLDEIFGKFDDRVKVALDGWFAGVKSSLQALHERANGLAITQLEAAHQGTQDPLSPDALVRIDQDLGEVRGMLVTKGG